MDANGHLQWGRPHRSVLSILFYSIAGLIVLAGLVFIVMLLASSGDIVVYPQELGHWTLSVGNLLLNAALLALFFWACGAVLSYLHGIRENTRIIACRLGEAPKSKAPSEN